MRAFEIVYIYALQFPEAVWTKLPLNVAHKETGDFNEKSLRKFTREWNTTHVACWIRQRNPTSGRQGEYLPPCMAFQSEVLGVICHPQNEPLIPVI